MKRLLTAVFVTFSALSMPTLAVANDSHMYDQLNMRSAIQTALTNIVRQNVAAAQDALNSSPNNASNDLRALASFDDIEGIRDSMLAAALKRFTTREWPVIMLLMAQNDFQKLMGYTLSRYEAGKFEADAAYNNWWGDNYAFPKPAEQNLGFHMAALYDASRTYVTIYRMAQRISELAPTDMTDPAVVALRTFEPTPAFAETVRQFAANEFSKPEDPTTYEFSLLADHAWNITEFMVGQMSPNAWTVLAETEWLSQEVYYDDGNTPQGMASRTKELEALMSKRSK